MVRVNKNHIALIISLIALSLAPIVTYAQEANASDAQTKTRPSLDWSDGPTTGMIGGKATIQVPDGYVFMDAANTRIFLEMTGNPPSDHDYMIGPRSQRWFAIFSFSNSGYIKDNEKIDPDALLRNLKSQDKSENFRRDQLHMNSLYTDDWIVTPHYDKDSKQLEWGLLLHDSDGNRIVNYKARILGRNGVMNATLVTDENALAADRKSFKEVLQGFRYDPGENYSEFKPGDKVAKYGLAALIAGGVTAVAAKKGFFTLVSGALAAFWKLMVAAFMVALAFIRKLFKRK